MINDSGGGGDLDVDVDVDVYVKEMEVGNERGFKYWRMLLNVLYRVNQ